eukprot:1336995-Amorphochlora_amoeboformis.AAC.1
MLPNGASVAFPCPQRRKGMRRRQDGGVTRRLVTNGSEPLLQILILPKYGGLQACPTGSNGHPVHPPAPEQDGVQELVFSSAVRAVGAYRFDIQWLLYFCWGYNVLFGLSDVSMYRG